MQFGPAVPPGRDRYGITRAAPGAYGHGMTIAQPYPPSLPA
jgi:hypothetical protein